MGAKPAAHTHTSPLPSQDTLSSCCQCLCLKSSQDTQPVCVCTVTPAWGAPGLALGLVLGQPVLGNLERQAEASGCGEGL